MNDQNNQNSPMGGMPVDPMAAPPAVTTPVDPMAGMPQAPVIF